MSHSVSARVRQSFLVCVLLVGAACGREPDAPAPAAPAPIQVTASAVESREVDEVLRVTGSFAADEESDVTSETSGQVAATPVDVGSRVARGAVVVRLDRREAELRLRQTQAAEQQAVAGLGQARARHALAQATANRYANLAETGDVSRTVYEQVATEAETSRQQVATAEAALAEVRSRVALAQKAANDTVIRAPIDGFVTARHVAVGESVTPATKLLTITRIDPIRLLLSVPATDAGRISTGQRVVAEVDAYPNVPFEGTVTALNPAISTSSRAMTVEARIKNPLGQLQPGMFATAEIAQGTSVAALVVPASAIINDTNTNSVRAYVVENGAARLAIVQAGEERDGMVRILQGLSAGETVATSNLDRLFDGAPVEVSRVTSTAPSTPNR